MPMHHTDEPAGLLRRIGAVIYDTLVLISLLIAAAMIPVMINGGNAIPPGTIWFELYLYLTGLLYFGYCWIYKGQTLGMRAWRLSIRSSTRGKPSWQQVVMRYLAATVSLATLGIGYLWMLLDKDKLTWHDRLSGTELVRVHYK